MRRNIWVMAFILALGCSGATAPEYSTLDGSSNVDGSVIEIDTDEEENHDTNDLDEEDAGSDGDGDTDTDTDTDSDGDADTDSDTDTDADSDTDTDTDVDSDTDTDADTDTDTDVDGDADTDVDGDTDTDGDGDTDTDADTDGDGDTDTDTDTDSDSEGDTSSDTIACPFNCIREDYWCGSPLHIPDGELVEGYECPEDEPFCCDPEAALDTDTYDIDTDTCTDDLDLCCGVVCDDPPKATCEFYDGGMRARLLEYKTDGVCIPSTGECDYGLAVSRKCRSWGGCTDTNGTELEMCAEMGEDEDDFCVEDHLCHGTWISDWEECEEGWHETYATCVPDDTNCCVPD